MARQIWLLRHGDAEPHGARPDYERRLTERGEEQSVSAGVALKALGIAPAAIYTSPKVRARDTAALAGRELGADPVEHAALAGGFAASDALELAMSASESEGPVLLVGHEPDFSQVVHDLSGARIDMKKGGVAGLRLEGSRAELIVLLRPRELSRVR
jgi:phosphohistidine phosphatase